MTGRDSPGILGYERGACTYELGTGRMSPSSWDSDSDEEDSDSSRDLTTFQINGIEDRRQSLTRLKRRKSTCKSWEHYSAVPKPESFRHRYDWDPDEIILDIENFLKDQSFLRSKPDPRSDNAGYNNREGVANFRNLSVRLSRILEVEESSMNIASESSMVSPLEKDDKIYDCKRQTDECEVSGSKSRSSGGSSTTVCSPEKDSSSESNSDGSGGMWNRIRKRIKKRNEELIATYRDSENFNESLARFLGGGRGPDTLGQKRGSRKDGPGKQDSALRERSVNRKGDELSVSFPAMSMERKFDEDKISIDGVEDVRDCTALTDESGTPKRDGNLTGKAMDHALFLESTRSGSGESSSLTRPVFPISSGGESTQLKVPGDCNECFQSSPASRDTFLINQSVTSNKSNESASSKKEIYKPENQRLSSDLSEKSQSSLSRDTSYKSNGREQKSLLSGDNGSNSSFNILLDLDGSDNDGKCSTVERKIFGDSFSEGSVTQISSPVSGRAENRDKNPSSPVFEFSETGKSLVNTTFGAENVDSPSNFRLLDYEEFDTGDNEWNTGTTHSKKGDQPQDQRDVKYESNATKSEWGKLAATLDEERKAKSKSTVFWIDLTDGIRADCFKGDGNRKILKPKSYIATKGAKRKTRWTANNVNLAQKRTQARKRKRESNFQPFVIQSNYSSYLLHRQREKNWFVKKFTRRRSKSTLGKGKVPESFLVTGRDYSSGTKRHLPINHTSHFSDSSTNNCFRTLFKQIANAFTVSWQKIRNFTV